MAAYVPHWRIGVVDGGPGHCFPSGHAVAAFAFLPGYFLLREQRPGWAHAWLAAVCVAGAAFGAAQVVRGAHYPSHTLWSAWLCWVVCVVVAHGHRITGRMARGLSVQRDPRI
jgi:membrane-associated PAP2 superfamily phosphatase